MLFRNIMMYHKRIGIALAIASLKISFLFLLDINSDFQFSILYVRKRCLYRKDQSFLFDEGTIIGCGPERWILFAIICLPILLPLLIEIVCSLCCCCIFSKGSTCRFRTTTLIANLLNQEKCLNMPKDPN